MDGTSASGSEARAGVLDALLLGASIPLGWVLHDLAIFLCTGEPGHVLASLLPGSAVAVLAGAVTGLVAARWACAVAASGPPRTDPQPCLHWLEILR